jgi:hypothetical protein
MEIFVSKWSVVPLSYWTLLLKLFSGEPTVFVNFFGGLWGHRRSVLENIGGFDESYSLAFD